MEDEEILDEEKLDEDEEDEDEAEDDAALDGDEEILLGDSADIDGEWEKEEKGYY